LRKLNAKDIDCPARADQQCDTGANARKAMKFLLQIVSIVRDEASFLLQNPKKLLSGAVLACVPAMYCVLYITSVWDPETKTNALPVAVVNLDEGVKYREHTFNVGWEIATQLEDSGRFGFVMSGDEQNARTLVRQGKLAFAVIIPRDFSASAVPGAEAGAGKVVIYTSQGNNFETAAIAKHFAETLGREINERLNERRWVLVLHNAAGSQRNVDHLRETVGKLRASARELSADTGQTTADVQALAVDLAKGAGEAAARATNLVNATQTNKQRVARISADIELLAKALPDKVDGLAGSAEGLASSVAPVVEIDAPVQNSGSGFASNIVPGALWLGAAVAAVLIHVRVLPRHAQFFSRPAQVAGKIFIPACVVLAQSLMVFTVVLYILKIHVVNPWTFAMTLIVSSLAFLSVVFALIKGFGDAGEGITMVLLAVQLSASGGILPVELSGGLFAMISPWLPLTWVVESVKVSMFGAFGGAWQQPLLLVGLAGLAGFALSCGVGRWRVVHSTSARSATES
jgi:YhgE/Pip-like protein